MTMGRLEKSTVQVGVIGTGWVATERHIPAFKKDGRASVVAVYDPNDSKAKATAKRFRIRDAFYSLESFLQAPIDVVSVCAPPAAHASLVEASLRSGKHVLVEKPMTLTSEEGKALEELAQRSGVTLWPAHNFLFSRSMEKAKALIDRGVVGEVKWVSGVQMSSWRRRLPTWFESLPGGLFFDEAPHLLYLMRYLIGELEVEEAWRTNESHESSSRIESVEARLKGATGGGHLSMWFGAPLSEWLVTAFCSNAVLVVDLFRDILIHLPPERAHDSRDVMRVVLGGTAQLWSGMLGSGVKFLRSRLLYGHDALVRHFLDAVVGGGEPLLTARDGWEVISLMEEILRISSEKIERV